MVWVLGKAIARRYKELTVRKFFISTEIAAQKKPGYLPDLSITLRVTAKVWSPKRKSITHIT